MFDFAVKAVRSLRRFGLTILTICAVLMFAVELLTTRYRSHRIIDPSHMLWGLLIWVPCAIVWNFLSERRLVRRLVSHQFLFTARLASWRPAPGVTGSAAPGEASTELSSFRP